MAMDDKQQMQMQMQGQMQTQMLMQTNMQTEMQEQTQQNQATTTNTTTTTATNTTAGIAAAVAAGATQSIHPSTITPDGAATTAVKGIITPDEYASSNNNINTTTDDNTLNSRLASIQVQHQLHQLESNANDNDHHETRDIQLPSIPTTQTLVLPKLSSPAAVPYYSPTGSSLVMTATAVTTHAQITATTTTAAAQLGMTAAASDNPNSHPAINATAPSVTDLSSQGGRDSEPDASNSSSNATIITARPHSHFSHSHQTPFSNHHSPCTISTTTTTLTTPTTATTATTLTPTHDNSSIASLSSSSLPFSTPAIPITSTFNNNNKTNNSNVTPQNSLYHPVAFSPTAQPSTNNGLLAASPVRLRSVTSAPLLTNILPPSRDRQSPDKQANNARTISPTKGILLKLTLPANPYRVHDTKSSQLGVLSSSEVSTPVSPTRSPRSVKSAISNSSLRSPALSPRKRSTATAGSRYSPPPVFNKNLKSTLSDLPPTPSLPQSPAALENPTSDYLSVPSPKKNIAILTPTTNQAISDATSTASITRSQQSSIPSIYENTSIKNGSTAPSAVPSYRPSGIPQSAPMAADASLSRRAMRSASITRPTHGRAFSTDMRQPSSEDIARQREQREQDRDRKAMLNKALQKAHKAVVSDNAYNYEEAITEYRDACELLHQVLLRSTADEERKKLDQIRETYSKRINELVEQERETKTAVSGSNSVAGVSSHSYARDGDFLRSTETRPQSLGLTSARSPAETVSDTSTIRNEPPKLTLPASSFGLLSAPMNPVYAPPPLSPRREPPSIPTTNHDRVESNERNLQIPNNSSSASHSAVGSISWLGTVSSGTSSGRSSTLSIEQANAIRKAFTATIPDDTEAEFDAALDAAVEAAYADGSESADYTIAQPATQSTFHLNGPPALKISKSRNTAKGFYIDGDEDEDEVKAAEATKNQALDEFDFGLQNKSSFARDSDGSQFSGSTYHSSVASSRTTQSTSLSTVTEGSETTLLSGNKVLGTLPRLSEETSRPDSMAGAGADTRGGGLSLNPSGSVRSRRMSGPNTKQLKIETMRSQVAPSASHGATTAGGEDSATLRPMGPTPGQIENLKPSNTIFVKTIPQQPLNGAVQHPMPNSGGTRSLLSPSETTFTLSPGTPGLPISINGDGQSPKSFRAHGARPFLRKNKSTMSLKGRTLSMSSPDGSDGSVATPMSQTFSYANLTNSSTALTRKTTGLSTIQTISDVAGSRAPPSTNLAIFDADIHSPTSPGVPNSNLNNAPIPLEPCPEPVLLRPFWLLRCVYQTIAHPRGGYISTRLFVPRDAWRVKGVKLKALDEKIAQLDTLTNSLIRLNMIDTNDMESVLEEMQTLEGTLDIVQAALQKKLGHDVGTHGLNSMFRDAPVDSGPATGSGEDPGKSQQGHRTSSKSYLSSWRKLRSKTSSSALSSQNHPNNRGSGPKDGKDDPAPTMATVPMTSMMNIKFAKRDIKLLDVNASNSGPNAAYMASLARLCDAVQVVDLIARQVEDPGLKGSSSTHVGLELCTRHASEFFGFFICRIVLADVGLLLDKYLKRGTEWVLA